MAFLIWSIFLITGVVCSADERIIGGNPTSVERHPSIIQVETVSNNMWWQSCAGNILTTTYILTAAHCFPPPPSVPQRFRIRAGATHRSTGGIIRNIRRLINHPTWGRNDFDGDIGLLQLTNPLAMSNVIRQARIPPQGHLPGDHQPVQFAGWGMTTYPGGSASPVLREVTVNVFNNDVCRQRYAALARPRVITRNMICAGTPQGGQGACWGDSGGPLYHNGVVVGIVSFGYSCADARHPGVAAAVAPYTNWIIQNAV